MTASDINIDINISKIVDIRRDFIYPEKPVVARGPRNHNSVVFATEGTGRFTGNGQKLIINEGDFHFFKSGILNRSEALGRRRSYIFANFETYDDSVFERTPFSPVMLLSNRAAFESDFHSLLSAFEGKGVGYMLQCRGLLYRIFKTLLCDIVQDQPITRQHKRIQAAISHIHNHYSRDIPVDEIARLCALSPRQLTRCFQDVYGKAPHEYLLETRMHVAKELLKDTMHNISVIASLTGYDSVYSFSRMFKLHTGFSPSDYRNVF